MAIESHVGVATGTAMLLTFLVVGKILPGLISNKNPATGADLSERRRIKASIFEFKLLVATNVLRRSELEMKDEK